ncbi:ribonuclease P protein component [Neolewinella antarctica]|uniref:Ribonuclease P protein component n=1 Tax=Neolewinella antarctica TaxID=442734 RepID=A0ABX0XCL1_9BACT|nr:ribonuclease P protein component [Neolewinella antarctica]NJC26691.1 ribonuclease P protein component [Neolewinella antarctica]
MSLKLHNGQRLKSRKEIGRLFSKNAKSANSYPVRAVYAEVEEPRNAFPVQVTFVVPKRRFKKAVDRNRIKRQMREAYRLHQDILARPPRQSTGLTDASRVQGESGQLAMLFMYTGKEMMEYGYIERKVKKVLEAVGA